MSVAILTDVTKCVGCLECVAACKNINKLAKDEPRFWQKNDGLSSRNWTSVVSKLDGHYVRKQCRHCLEPACASACPVGALHKTPEGPVVYDAEKCLGCRYCMMACPYGIPRYEWDQKVPYVRKCIMCYEEHEVGGTSVLYVSDIDLGFLCYQPDLTTALPSTTELAMRSVPFAFLGMGAVMLSVNWVVKRRQELARNGDERDGEVEE